MFTTAGAESHSTLSQCMVSSRAEAHNLSPYALVLGTSRRASTGAAERLVWAGECRE